MKQNVELKRKGWAWPQQDVIKQDVDIRVSIAGDDESAVAIATAECDQVKGTSRAKKLILSPVL